MLSLSEVTQHLKNNTIPIFYFKGFKAQKSLMPDVNMTSRLSARLWLKHILGFLQMRTIAAEVVADACYCRSSSDICECVKWEKDFRWVKFLWAMPPPG